MEDIEKQYKLNIDKLLLYFFIYSALGWILETLYSYILLGHFENRGFLIGPLCPIYGFGMLIMIIWLSKYKDHKIKLFFISVLVFSIFEYVVGYALDAIFNLKWWDYTNDFLNINGRITLFYSLGWGIIGLIVINIIHPFVENFLDKILDKIPIMIQSNLLKIVVIIFIIDIVLSSIGYIQK